MDSQMQDAKQIKRFFLECTLGSVCTKQGFCVLSHNSTDALDLFSRLRQVMKGHSDEISEAANKPTPQCLRSWDFFPGATLIVVSNVAHSEKRSSGFLLFVPPAQRIENSSGGGIADDIGR